VYHADETHLEPGAPPVPQLIQPSGKYMLKHSAVDRRAVIDQVHSVLKVYAMKPEFSRFYIGITSNLETRLRDHQANKPEYKLMIPIYEEERMLLSDSFDQLERDAIARFRQGIRHPDTGQMLLSCWNGPGGARPKSVLYVMVG
jgi:predicted GIY-YIG superfamily endonuclease